MADQGLSEASWSLLGQQPMHSSTPIKGKQKAGSHQHGKRDRHAHSQHYHDSVQTIDTQPGSGHGSPRSGAVHSSLTPASLLHQQQHVQQLSKSWHHNISSHQSQHHHQPLQDDVNIRMQDEMNRSKRSDMTGHHQELSLTQVAQHLESDTIQKQRRELQLLIEELKGRDRELNAMVTHHQNQLQAWELDRRRILMLEQRCAKLQSSLQTKTNEMAGMVGRLSLLESEEHSHHHVIENTQQQLSMLSEQHSHATHHIQQLEEQNRSLNDSVKESRSNMEQLAGKEKKLSEALKAKERNIQEASVEISDLESKLKTSEQQLTELGVKEAEARKIAEDWKERYTQRGQELDQVQEELSKSQASVDDLQTQLKRATTELKNYQLEKEIADEREQRKDELLALQRSKQERMEAELGSLRQLHERQQRDLSLLHLNLESSKDLLARQAAVYAEKSSVTSISMARSSQDHTREESNLQSLSPILKQPEGSPSDRDHRGNHTGQGPTSPDSGGSNGLHNENGEEDKSMKVSESQDGATSTGRLNQGSTIEMKHGENSSDASRNTNKNPRTQKTEDQSELKYTKLGVDKQSTKSNAGKPSQCVLSPSKTRAGPSSHAVTKTKTSPVKTRTQGNTGAKKGAVGKTLSKSSGRQSTPRKIAVSSQLKVPNPDVEGIKSSPAVLQSELTSDCNTDRDKSCTSLKMTHQHQQQSMMTGTAAEVNHAGTKGQVQHGKKSVYGSPKTLVQLYTDLNDSVRESVQEPTGANAKQPHSPQKEHINPDRDQLCKKLFDDDEESGESKKLVYVVNNNIGANDALDEEEIQQHPNDGSPSQCDAVLSSLNMYHQVVPSTVSYTHTHHLSSSSSSATSSSQAQFVLKEKLNSPIGRGQRLDGFRLGYSAPQFAVNNSSNCVAETTQNHVIQPCLSDGHTAASQNHQQRTAVVQGQFEKHLNGQNINLQMKYMVNPNIATSHEQITEKGQGHMSPKGQGHILTNGQGQVLSDTQGWSSDGKTPADPVSASFPSASAGAVVNNFHGMMHSLPGGIQMMPVGPGSTPLIHQPGHPVVQRQVSEGGQTMNHQANELHAMQQRNQMLEALLEYQAAVRSGQTGDVDRSTTPHDHNLQDNEVEPSPLGKLHQLLTESKQMVQDMGSTALPKYFSSS